MSGQAPYGFDLEPTVVENIRTKMMVADPRAASHVRLMFEMYAEPETSLEILPGILRNGVSKYMEVIDPFLLIPALRNPSMHRLT